MRYCDTIAWSLSAGTTQVQQFRMNSTFDPDVTGSGHQPYGRDQLAALFNHYRVFRCAWHIEFAPSNDRLIVAVVPINGTTIPATVGDAAELPMARTKAMSFGGGPPCKFFGTTYLPKLAGVTSAHYRADDLYAAAVGTDPAEGLYLNIVVNNPSLSTVVTTMQAVITYWVEWYDPITVGPS